MGYYSDLLTNGGPWVTFERCVERAMTAVVKEFVAEVGGPLAGAVVYEGHSGLPKVFGGWNTKEGGEDFAEVAGSASHILLVGTGREDREGEEVCELTVVVATMITGGDPDAQLLLHEARVAAMRGILSDGACQETGAGSVLGRLAAAETQAVISGWHRKDGPAEMEYVGARWVATERYEVRGYRVVP